MANASAPATVLDLARACGLNRSTAWRLLATLERQGLVERDPATQRYSLGYAVFQIAAGDNHDSLVRRTRTGTRTPCPRDARNRQPRGREALQPRLCRSGRRAARPFPQLARALVAAARDLGRKGVPRLAPEGGARRDLDRPPQALHLDDRDRAPPTRAGARRRPAPRLQRLPRRARGDALGGLVRRARPARATDRDRQRLGPEQPLHGRAPSRRRREDRTCSGGDPSADRVAAHAVAVYGVVRGRRDATVSAKPAARRRHVACLVVLRPGGPEARARADLQPLVAVRGRRPNRSASPARSSPAARATTPIVVVRDRERRAAGVRQRLPPPRARGRAGLRAARDAPVPVPRVDVRPRRLAARRAALRAGAGLRPRRLGLRPVLVETWGPLVFVNPDPDARAARRDARRPAAEIGRARARPRRARLPRPLARADRRRELEDRRRELPRVLPLPGRAQELQPADRRRPRRVRADDRRGGHRASTGRSRGQRARDLPYDPGGDDPHEPVPLRLAELDAQHPPRPAARTRARLPAARRRADSVVRRRLLGAGERRTR